MEALFFSGGIDSLATLFVLRDRWDKLLVMWCDSQAAYRETEEYMEKIQKLVPNFLRVQGQQPLVVELYGWPADVVPTNATKLGRALSGSNGTAFQTTYECCSRSLWLPMDNAIRQLGIKVVYRGQKKADRIKSPIESGFVDAGGIEYRFPINDWTREEVFAYCEKECPELIRPHYAQGEETSRDCWNCTGYLWENKRRIENLPDDQRAFVQGKIDELLDCVRKDFPS